MGKEQGASDKSDRAVVNGAASVSALRASVPSAFSEIRDERLWLHPDDMPPFDQRPPRQFILVEGFRQHSGEMWHRVWADTAFIRRNDRPDFMLGYRLEDILRIMRDGDMDCAERVIGWLPAAFPYLNAIAPAQAIEARRAETGTGSVHESAVAPAEYRGWTIDRGRWPEPEWMAVHPDYDASWEGEEDGWVDNGLKADGSSYEALCGEIDCIMEEHPHFIGKGQP